MQLLSEVNLTRILHNDSTRNKYNEWLAQSKGHHEKTWDFLCMLHDLDELQTLHDIPGQLNSRESLYFSNYTSGNLKEILPVEVNTDNLLSIDKKVGIKCPECGEQETSYRLYANRSADEGMTSYCSCRICKHTWRIKM